MVTGVDDQVHAIDEVLRAYHPAWPPKRLELLQVDQFGCRSNPARPPSRRNLRNAACGAR
jgi:hypothetical protein